LVAERLVAERLVAERLVAERLVAERLVAERLVAERLVAERFLAPPDINEYSSSIILYDDIIILTLRRIQPIITISDDSFDLFIL
jgi:hypothetical protein